MNSASQLDFVSIVTGLEILYDKKQTFNCDICINQFTGRPDEMKRLKNIKDLKGCTSLKNEPLINLKHGKSTTIQYYKCAGNFYDRSINYLTTIHEQFQRGFMPFGGSLMDTPARLIEVINLFDSVKHRLTLENQGTYDK